MESEMKVDPVKPNDLVMTYWVGDRNSAEFDIFVDGQKLFTETVPSRKPNAFFDELRNLLVGLTKDKSMVLVNIQAITGKSASSGAGARTVRRASGVAK
jgi:hypothetical protein